MAATSQARLGAAHLTSATCVVAQRRHLVREMTALPTLLRLFVGCRLHARSYSPRSFVMSLTSSGTTRSKFISKSLSLAGSDRRRGWRLSGHWLKGEGETQSATTSLQEHECRCRQLALVDRADVVERQVPTTNRRATVSVSRRESKSQSVCCDAQLRQDGQALRADRHGAQERVGSVPASHRHDSAHALALEWCERQEQRHWRTVCRACQRRRRRCQQSTGTGCCRRDWQ